MSTWVGTYEVSNTITHVDSPYQASNGELVLLDSSGGAITVVAPLNPLPNSSFRVQSVKAAGFDITIDGNGKSIRDTFTGGALAPAITGFDAYLSVIMFYDDTVWDASTSSPTLFALKFSTDLHIAGTVEVIPFQTQRYDPSAGSMVIEAPASPYKRMRWGIANETASVSAITIDGNGNDIQDPSFNPVASFVSMAPNARGEWEWNGDEWLLLQQGGGLLTGAGNQASISRPFNGTTDVDYAAGFQTIEQYTAESSGNALDADFLTSSITINKQGLFRIEGQNALASKTGSRTDVSIALNGVQTEDRWVSQGTGLTEPSSFQPVIAEVAVSTTPVVVTQVVSNDASGNRTVRHYALRLAVIEL